MRRAAFLLLLLGCADPPPVAKVANLSPDFTLLGTDDGQHSLSHYRGRYIILYFFPKAGSPGCIREAREFAAATTEIKRKNAVVLGVSPDTLDELKSFRRTWRLPFVLLSDPHREAIDAYKVWGMRKVGSREVEGIIRSTFLIDPTGRLSREWRKVPSLGHAKAVLSAIPE
jgi:peroxiredoxin Q/BCP